MAYGVRPERIADGLWPIACRRNKQDFFVRARSYSQLAISSCFLPSAISHTLLQIVLLKTAPESLLLGKVVGIVQGCEIGDSFLGLVTRIRIDDLDAISRGEGIEEIDQSKLVILIEAPSGFAVLERPFNDKKPRGESEELFECVKKGQSIVGGIRVDRIEFFHADALDAQEFGCFGNGITAGWKDLSNDSGDAHEALKVVGEVLPWVDVEMNGRHHSFWLTLPREHQERLGAARVLAGSWALLRSWRCGGVRFRRWAWCRGWAWRWPLRGRGLDLGIVAGACDGVAEGLIGLVEQLCPGFRLAVQCR